MATAFILNATGFNGQPIEVSRQRFTGLPIRLGRNALNDFQINEETISSFHARIEDAGGRLLVVDLRSKNGVHVRVHGQPAVRKVQPDEPADLSLSDFEFYLSAHVKVHVTFEEIRDALEYRGASGFQGSVLGNRNMLLDPSPAALGGGAMPGYPAAQGVPGPPAVPAFGGAQPYVPLPPLPGEAGHSPYGGGGYTPAPTGPPPAMPGGSGAPQRRPSASTAFFNNLAPEMLALQGLRELAASLLPGTTLDTTGDVARFITKVHDALDVFFRSFLPLRDGYAQFLSSLDLQGASQRSAFSRSVQRSPAYMAIEAAMNSEQVARALLNPHDPGFDAPQAIEGVFADLILHQMAVLEGMMKGVRALLEELSPENIAQHTESSLPFFKYKELWQTYSRRFEDLYEERQTFAYLFGPEFTAAYRQYRKRPPSEVP